MEEKLYFKNSRGNKLCGILTDPTDNKDVPIIVLCHGFASSKDSHTCAGIAAKLREKNIPTFRFDFFAHGESEGNFEDLTVTEAIDDTMKAIEFMREKGFKKVGLFGSSFGGLSSYIVASKSPRLSLLIEKAAVASFAHMPEFTPQKMAKWKKQGFGEVEGKKLKYGFFLDALKNNAYDIADKIKIPTLIIHGNADNDVPVNQSINIAKYIQNCALEIVVGADHRFSDRQDFEQLINSIASFVLAHLK